jgi:hypothetical protein
VGVGSIVFSTDVGKEVLVVGTITVGETGGDEEIPAEGIAVRG